jgi:membrane protein implicated in regulation of membrane protease activity
MPLFWLVIAMIALLVEAVATHFLLFFVAIAALLTAGLAALSTPLAVQVVVFSIASVCLPLLFRRRLLRRFAGPGVPSRAEGLLGLPAVVIEAIDPALATGRVMTNGQDWKARSTSRVDVGSMTKVVGVDGIVLVVEPAIAGANHTHST